LTFREKIAVGIDVGSTTSKAVAVVEGKDGVLLRYIMMDKEVDEMLAVAASRATAMG
jgi:activator of 2-hydroxyglutaryl-CoA dehydratase